MKDAVEMAVLGAVAHPNIVQLYACLTDMVEASGLPGVCVCVCVCVCVWLRCRRPLVRLCSRLPLRSRGHPEEQAVLSPAPLP